jgi:tRNA modification GTPase
MEALCQVEGVRPAGRGEFTRRAFENGKLDLVQAEAVHDMLFASREADLRNAQKLLAGELSGEVRELARAVREISAQLEMEVDFVEEEATGEEVRRAFDEWRPRLLEVRDALQSLLDNFCATQGTPPRVAFFGAPNAGKSSLINALVAQDRLLVSSAPGTTRDFVEVPVALPGGSAFLVDTAGLSEKLSSPLDRAAMQKSMQALKTATLKILCVDCTAAPSEISDPENLDPDLVVYTKSDLLPPPGHSLSVSSKTGAGIQKLTNKLNEILFPQASGTEAPWVASRRQRGQVEEALAGVERAILLCEEEIPPVELLAFEMQTVRTALRSIVGEVSSEAVLSEIFENFCVGK